ncbi:hypothetical protein ABID59_002134 [Bradyrhizobium sp. S3.3.6]|uniref:hypothetical protein n=1 Tax=Bradyrhizobium sp. S3.3.6 TaxID=3156429 RepID=UPI0033985EC5
MDADAKFHPVIGRNIGVLNRNPRWTSTAQRARICDTGKLNQHSIASSLDDASTINSYCRIDENRIHSA